MGNIARAKLYQPLIDGPGELSIEGSRLAVGLEASLSKLLAVLTTAQERDEVAGVPESFQGYRTRRQLRELYAALNGDYPPTEETISEYLWRITQKLTKAAGELGREPPQFFERRPGRGVRLAVQLEIDRGVMGQNPAG